MTTINTKAIAELDSASKCNPAAITAAVNQVIKRYGATEKVVKNYPNGLVKVQILDEHGAYVAEYTRVGVPAVAGADRGKRQ